MIVNQLMCDNVSLASVVTDGYLSFAMIMIYDVQRLKGVNTVLQF